MTSHRSAPQSL